jgi:hypothetical protein
LPITRKAVGVGETALEEHFQFNDTDPHDASPVKNAAFNPKMAISMLRNKLREFVQHLRALAVWDRLRRFLLKPVERSASLEIAFGAIEGETKIEEYKFPFLIEPASGYVDFRWHLLLDAVCGDLVGGCSRLQTVTDLTWLVREWSRRHTAYDFDQP